MHSLLMCDFIFLRSYNNVVHVNLQPSLCNFFSEDIVHHCLEGCWGVCQAEEHDHRLEEPFACFKGGFPLISLFDADVIVAPLYVKFGE
jgi:hypothetical protein